MLNLSQTPVLRRNLTKSFYRIDKSFYRFLWQKWHILFESRLKQRCCNHSGRQSRQHCSEDIFIYWLSVILMPTNGSTFPSPSSRLGTILSPDGLRFPITGHILFESRLKQRCCNHSGRQSRQHCKAVCCTWSLMPRNIKLWNIGITLKKVQ